MESVLYRVESLSSFSGVYGRRRRVGGKRDEPKEGEVDEIWRGLTWIALFVPIP